VETSAENASFREIVIQYFADFLRDHGFSLSPERQTGGKFVNVDFACPDCTISISFEYGEDYLLVILQKAGCVGVLDFDNPERTMRLEDLTRRVLPTVASEAFQANDRYFADLQITATTLLRREVLKRAKDLRLCLGHM